MITRIIHITLGKANPNRMNGVNKVVHSLATYQQRIHGNVQVWGITKSALEDDLPREYELMLFHNFGRLKLCPNLEFNIKSNASEHTIFHIHGSFNMELFRVAQTIAKFEGKFIYTSHGAFNVVAMRRSYFRKLIYTYLFERKIAKLAYKLHFIGASEMVGARKYLTSQKEFILVPNGQEVSSINPENTVSFNKIYFGFIGRLDIHTKGLDLLFDAIKLVSKSNSNIQLSIIGGGPGEKKLRNYVKENNLQEIVKFIGPLYGEDKLNAIKKMNYLCLNSRNEGLPGVVLEGLSFGVPVIISEETNLGDDVNAAQAGLVLKRNTVSELRKVLEEAVQISEEKYAIMSQNAVKLIATKFDWNIIAQRMIACYD